MKQRSIKLGEAEMAMLMLVDRLGYARHDDLVAVLASAPNEANTRLLKLTTSIDGERNALLGKGIIPCSNRQSVYYLTDCGNSFLRESLGKRKAKHERFYSFNPKTVSGSFRHRFIINNILVNMLLLAELTQDVVIVRTEHEIQRKLMTRRSGNPFLVHNKLPDGLIFRPYDMAGPTFDWLEVEQVQKNGRNFARLVSFLKSLYETEADFACITLKGKNTAGKMQDFCYRLGRILFFCNIDPGKSGNFKDKLYAKCRESSKDDEFIQWLDAHCIFCTYSYENFVKKGNSFVNMTLNEYQEKIVANKIVGKKIYLSGKARSIIQTNKGQPL